MGRRHPPPEPILAGLDWPRAARLIQDYLRHLKDGFSGDPFPHQETHLVGGTDALATPGTPTTIDAGSIGAAGVGPAPAREDHEHGVTTGAPVALGESLAEGSGAALARASHVHPLSIRVAKAGSTVGTRKRINLVDGSGGSVTVSDDASGDQITITFGSASASGSSAESLSDWYTRKSVEAYAVRPTIATTYR